MPSTAQLAAGTRAPGRAMLLVLPAIVLLLALLMPTTQFWDRDEAFYARTTVEMVRSADYLVPTFNDQTFADKPPLIYWLMAASASVFGENEFAFRLPSAFGMAGAAFFLFLIGSRMFSPRAGLWSVAVLSGSAMSVYLGSTAMLDAVLLTFVCAAIWALTEALYRPGRAAWLVPFFAVAMTLGWLTKGPVGPAVVLGMAGLTLLLLPKSDRPSRMIAAGFIGAAVVSFGGFLAWAIPANAASGGAILQSGIGLHIIGRALQPMQGHGAESFGGYLATLPVYIPVIMLGLFPWLLQLPAATAALVRGEIGTRRERAIIIGWFTPTLLMFTLAATKLPHYVFPLFPAAALAIAATIDGIERGAVSQVTRFWLNVGIWSYALVGTVMAAIVIGVATMLLDGGGIAVSTAFAALLVFVMVVVVRESRADRWRRASLILVAAAAPAYILFFWLVLPLLEPLMKISRPVAELVQRSVPASTPVYADGYGEPSLVFYLDRPLGAGVKPLPGDPAQFEALFGGSTGFVLIASEQRLAEIRRQAGDRPFKQIGSFSAFDTNAGGNWNTVIVATYGVGE